MALSSSPSLQADREFPSSPPLPPLPSSSRSLHSRKRPLSDYGSQSSDPIFSDATTDSEQLLDSSVARKRKRFVRAPWWRLRETVNKSIRSGLDTRRSFRAADSGVWMGSDEDSTPVEECPSSELDLVAVQISRNVKDLDRHPKPYTVACSESLAVKLVQECLDEGRERVDLSDLGLTSLSSATLQPLHQLIRAAHANQLSPPSEDEFSPLTPAIQLFLSRNSLSTLPPELFHLTNISVLSLRNNRLRHIPSAISRLTRIRECNVSGNELPNLPFEFLDLLSPGSGRKMTVRPNPFITPVDLTAPSPLVSTENQTVANPLLVSATAEELYQNLSKKHPEVESVRTVRGELELRLLLGRQLLARASGISRSGATSESASAQQELICLGSSQIYFLGIDGSEMRTSLKPAHRGERVWAASLSPMASLPSPPSSTPSLFEQSLRNLQHFDIEDAINILQQSATPRVIAALEKAAANVDQRSNSVCSTCKRAYIIPRAEWMEFWFFGPHSQETLTTASVLPFLRRSCSWDCAQPSIGGDFKV